MKLLRNLCRAAAGATRALSSVAGCSQSRRLRPAALLGRRDLNNWGYTSWSYRGLHPGLYYSPSRTQYHEPPGSLCAQALSMLRTICHAPATLHAGACSELYSQDSWSTAHWL